jgi:hypothetical protein
MLDLREQISSGFSRAGVGGPPISAPALPTNLGPRVPSVAPRAPSAKPPPLPAAATSSKGAVPSMRPAYNDDDE